MQYIGARHFFLHYSAIDCNCIGWGPGGRKLRSEGGRFGRGGLAAAAWAGTRAKWPRGGSSEREELRERGGRSAARVSRSEGSFETTWRELRVGATTESPTMMAGHRRLVTGIQHICRLPRMVALHAVEGHRRPRKRDPPRAPGPGRLSESVWKVRLRSKERGRPPDADPDARAAAPRPG